MKVIILAAGYATRLYPLTLTKPKPLLPVAGKPMIDHVIDNLAPISGIDGIYVVTNAKFAGHFQEWADDYRAKKARPAAFMDVGRASLITLGNLDDDLGLLAECDLILEAIIEQPAPKQALYARLEPLRKPNAIIASNTSGIPMKVLTEGRSARFKQHFLDCEQQSEFAKRCGRDRRSEILL